MRYLELSASAVAGVAALGGALLAVQRIRREPPPRSLRGLVLLLRIGQSVGLLLSLALFGALAALAVTRDVWAWPDVVDVVAGIMFAVASLVLVVVDLAQWFRRPEDRSVGRVSVVVPARSWVVVAVFLVTAAALTFAVVDGVDRLTVAEGVEGTAGAVGRLLLLAGASGVVAFAVVEFVKRLSPLRASFNEAQVARFFGPGLMEVREALLRYLVDSPNDEGDIPARRWVERVPLALSARWSYDSTIPQLTAQIAAAQRDLARSVRENADLPPWLRARALWTVVGDAVVVKILLGDGPPPDGDERSRMLDDLVERRMDLFQVEALARWRTRIRSLSAVVAGAVASLAAGVTTSAASAAVTAALLGAIVGGPISWVVRDLTRVVERRAQF